MKAGRCEYHEPWVHPACGESRVLQVLERDPLLSRSYATLAVKLALSKGLLVNKHRIPALQLAAQQVSHQTAPVFLLPNPVYVPRLSIRVAIWGTRSDRQ
jgi:hypothetical protein